MRAVYQEINAARSDEITSGSSPAGELGAHGRRKFRHLFLGPDAYPAPVEIWRNGRMRPADEKTARLHCRLILLGGAADVVKHEITVGRRVAQTQFVQQRAVAAATLLDF